MLTSHLIGLRSALVAPIVVVFACDRAPRTEGSDNSLMRADSAAHESAISPQRQLLTGNRVAGIRFDPRAIGPGARIGAMTLDSLTTRTANDSIELGTAVFSGTVELSGAKFPHFDADADALCFEADSASASRLPRWEGDERRSWFCFTNRAPAVRALGPPGDSARATIVIDRLTIHRGMSDEVNSARFVRAITR